jgi:ABC-type multidrug transport system ATPase subunit
VVLTTHTMAEAEALSKRIGILVNGELKCIGNK